MSEQPTRRPCPFCGGTAISMTRCTMRVDQPDTVTMEVFCGACDAQGAEGPTLAEAERLWNTRAVQP